MGYDQVQTAGAISQFTQQSKLYEKYKIYGMKFEYMPYMFNQLSANNVSLQRHWVATYPDGITTGTPQDAELI